MERKFDYFLFFLIFIVLIFSLLFFYTLSSPVSFQRFGSLDYYFKRQLFFGLVIGPILAFIVYKIPLRFFKKNSLWLFLINLSLLFLVFLPWLGTKIGGATRWFDFKLFNFQPAELFKITSILYLSSWLSSRINTSKTKGWRAKIKRGYHNIFHLLVPFLFLLLIISFAFYLQKDLSTLIVIGITLIVIYFYARTPLWHTLVVFGVIFSLFLSLITFESYRLSRIQTFLNPGQDPLGAGYQLNQSLIALGSGGVFGKGFGMSTQKFGFLPQSIADSIFAVIGEELGLIGASLVVFFFIVFFVYSLYIANKSQDNFGKLVSLGIGFWITFQAFINICSNINLFPMTGIPLPFFSYGGSHLIVELIAVSFLLKISKEI